MIETTLEHLNIHTLTFRDREKEIQWNFFRQILVQLRLSIIRFSNLSRTIFTIKDFVSCIRFFFNKSCLIYNRIYEMRILMLIDRLSIQPIPNT